MKQQNQKRCRQVSFGNEKLLHCCMPSGGSAKTIWDFYLPSLGKGLYLLQGNAGQAVEEPSWAHLAPGPLNHHPQSLSKRAFDSPVFAGAGKNFPAQIPISAQRSNQQRRTDLPPQTVLATTEFRSSNWQGTLQREQRRKASRSSLFSCSEAILPQHALSAVF